MQKRKETAVVQEQRQIAAGIYEMWIETELAKQAKPGQFISVYTQDKSALLPRPISICEIDEEQNRLRLVYRVVGKGTKEFSGYGAGNKIDILGTLGNGFPLAEAAGKRVFLMGGGIGVPPMLETAKQLAGNTVATDIIMGYRNNDLFLKEDFEKYGNVHIATEDGSVGTKGNVMDVIREKKKHRPAGGASPSPTTEPGASTVDEVCDLKRSGGRMISSPTRAEQTDGHFQPKTTLSLRRKAKLHAEGASLSACGKHHSPKANITVQPPHGGCTMGDREAVEGAGGYESNDLPFMRCLPLFSSVGTEMSSLLCAFSCRHPCGAGRWGEATAPCSHPGGSHSDSRQRADMDPPLR